MITYTYRHCSLPGRHRGVHGQQRSLHRVVVQRLCQLSLGRIEKVVMPVLLSIAGEKLGKGGEETAILADGLRLDRNPGSSTQPASTLQVFPDFFSWLFPGDDKGERTGIFAIPICTYFSVSFSFQDRYSVLPLAFTYTDSICHPPFRLLLWNGTSFDHDDPPVDVTSKNSGDSSPDQKTRRRVENEIPGPLSPYPFADPCELPSPLQ